MELLSNYNKFKGGPQKATFPKNPGWSVTNFQKNLTFNMTPIKYFLITAFIDLLKKQPIAVEKEISLIRLQFNNNLDKIS